jgi:hypothetical protein
MINEADVDGQAASHQKRAQRCYYTGRKTTPRRIHDLEMTPAILAGSLNLLSKISIEATIPAAKAALTSFVPWR